MEDKEDVREEEAEDGTEAQARKKPVSIRAYLDQTVVPVLLLGMAALVKAKPEDEDPVEWLAKWMLNHQASQKGDKSVKTDEQL
jgi:protein dpy-30